MSEEEYIERLRLLLKKDREVNKIPYPKKFQYVETLCHKLKHHVQNTLKQKQNFGFHRKRIEDYFARDIQMYFLNKTQDYTRYPDRSVLTHFVNDKKPTEHKELIAIYYGFAGFIGFKENTSIAEVLNIDSEKERFLFSKMIHYKSVKIKIAEIRPSADTLKILKEIDSAEKYKEDEEQITNKSKHIKSKKELLEVSAEILNKEDDFIGKQPKSLIESLENKKIDEEESYLKSLKKEKTTYQNIIEKHLKIDSLLLENNNENKESNTQKFIFKVFERILKNDTFDSKLVEDIYFIIKPYNLNVTFEEVDISLITHALNISILRKWDENKLSILLKLLSKSYTKNSKQELYNLQTFYRRDIFGVVFSLFVNFKKKELFLYTINELSLFATNKRFVDDLYDCIYSLFPEPNKYHHHYNDVRLITNTNKNKLELSNKEEVFLSYFIDFKLDERFFIFLREIHTLELTKELMNLLESYNNYFFERLAFHFKKKGSYGAEYNFKAAMTIGLSQYLQANINYYSGYNISSEVRELLLSDVSYFVSCINYYFPKDSFLKSDANKKLSFTLKVSYEHPYFDEALKVANIMDDFDFFLSYVANFKKDIQYDSVYMHPIYYGWIFLIDNSDELTLKKYESFFNIDYRISPFLLREIGEYIFKSSVRVFSDKLLRKTLKMVLNVEYDDDEKMRIIFWLIALLISNDDSSFLNFRTYMDLKPDISNTEVNILIGIAYYNKNKMKEAITKFEEVIQFREENESCFLLDKYKNYPFIYSNLLIGHCYLYLGDIKRAKCYYEKSYTLNNVFNYQHFIEIFEDALFKERVTYQIDYEELKSDIDKTIEF